MAFSFSHLCPCENWRAAKETGEDLLDWSSYRGRLDGGRRPAAERTIGPMRPAFKSPVKRDGLDPDCCRSFRSATRGPPNPAPPPLASCRPVSPTRRNNEHQWAMVEELPHARPLRCFSVFPIPSPVSAVDSPRLSTHTTPCARGAAVWLARPLPAPSPLAAAARRPAWSSPWGPTRRDSTGVLNPPRPREARHAPACASWPRAPRRTQ